MSAAGSKIKKTIVVFVVICGLACGAGLGAMIALTYDLPQIRFLESFSPSAVTRLYSSDGVLLSELFAEKRDPVPLSLIPEYLKAALIATEDRKFYRHIGVDLKGIFRAVIKNIWAGEYVEGASTLTQQLAKTLFLTPRKTLQRKIKEAFLAFQLERRYTKDEILKLYLNQVYFGSGAYGVESAAQIFFGKSVRHLDLSECALVAGMPKAPSRYSPLVSEVLARKRRNIVLKQMLETGVINHALYQRASAEPIHLNHRGKPKLKAPYFVEVTKRFLENELGWSMLYKGGLSVYTTLADDLQASAENAVSKGIEALRRRVNRKHPNSADPQAALVSLDVRTGGVLSMVGGNDFFKSPFNRATDAWRQPGSAFKPIVYAYAAQRGFPQSMLILDAPIVFKGARAGRDWMPENFSNKFLGEITLRKALAVSENIPAIRLLEKLGPSPVCKFGYGLGITTPLLSNLSLALGTSEVTLIDLTAAYAVFANQGTRIKPYTVTKVTDTHQSVVWQIKPQRHAAMTREAAAVMVDMLQAVVNEGTGKRARALHRPVAGKTGTTNDFKDALFIGFSPSIATGVWVGRDDHTTLGKGETGARAALPIWTGYMETAIAKHPVDYFDIPDGVARKWMDPQTGKLSDTWSDGFVKAVFITGEKGLSPKGLE
jgi:penicillin-binding protein 1A